ncbi:hypothetical protein AYI69_g2901 [Smittium culicis]|uniref:Uncharacterized protein n=1 Tax=Smittium culicis TaxID=133412 RepID=A0A1R1YL81_9FUNG|nr:hypothetical protein AYI69_g2901 [Smittium culicis]
MKCCFCSHWFEIHTDPKNAKYEVVRGAFKKNEDFENDIDDGTVFQGLENDKKNSLDLVRSSFAAMKKNSSSASEKGVFKDLNNSGRGAGYISTDKSPRTGDTAAKLAAADTRTSGARALPAIAVTTPLGMVLKSKALVSTSPFNKPQTSAKSMARARDATRPTTNILELATARFRRRHAATPITKAKAKSHAHVRGRGYERGSERRDSCTIQNGNCSSDPSTKPSVCNNHQATDALLSIIAYDSSSP